MKKFDLIADEKLRELHENFVQQASTLILSARTQKEVSEARKQVNKLLDEAMEQYKQYIFIR